MRETARNCRRLAGAAAVVALVACTTVAPPPPPAPAIKTTTLARYEAVAFDALPAIAQADLVAAWPAWLASCRAFERNSDARREAWRRACAAASDTAATPAAIRTFFATRFDVYRVLTETREDKAPNDGDARLLDLTDTGRITGYYEPLLAGSRSRDARYAVPLHRAPGDLLTIDLAGLFPDLAGQRVRGRLVESPGGKRVVPYWSRAEMDGGVKLAGSEIVWVDDAIEAFFLQIQGSGRVRLPDGSVIRVGYADTNGHPYRSIGRWLVEQGELTLDQASMQGIRAWARAHPKRLDELLNQNPSYVFFRELPLGDPNAGPLGALAVPLTPGYSVAADPRFMPLGAPVVLATRHPTSGQPLTRLMLAQDTGGAIRGPLRFDFFWGFGAAAGEQAGRQRHDVNAWLLVPRGTRPESLLAR